MGSHKLSLACFCTIVHKYSYNNSASDALRYCLWILGNERALCNCESIWELLISDAKGRQCFFNADDDKDLAKTILAAKKAYDEFDDLLNADSVLFRSARWKVHHLVPYVLKFSVWIMVYIHFFNFFFSF